MNLAFKILLFILLFNISSGIVATAFPTVFADSSMRSGVTYDPDFSSNFTNKLQRNVSPSPVVEDAGDAIYRILDMVSLGFIVNIGNTIKQYVFGFVKVLDVVFGGYLLANNPALYSLLFSFPLGLLYSFMMLAYTFFVFELFSGRVLNSE